MTPIEFIIYRDLFGARELEISLSIRPTTFEALQRKFVIHVFICQSIAAILELPHCES